MLPGLCVSVPMNTTRDCLSSSMRRLHSKKWPRWFTPTASSNPSAVRRGCLSCNIYMFDGTDDTVRGMIHKSVKLQCGKTKNERKNFSPSQVLLLYTWYKIMHV